MGMDRLDPHLYVVNIRYGPSFFDTECDQQVSNGVSRKLTSWWVLQAMGMDRLDPLLYVVNIRYALACWGKITQIGCNDACCKLTSYSGTIEVVVNKWVSIAYVVNLRHARSSTDPPLPQLMTHSLRPHPSPRHFRTIPCNTCQPSHECLIR